MVNAISGGSFPPLSNRYCGENTHCYDLVYKTPQENSTAFLDWVKRYCNQISEQSTQYTDGLGMLIEQAAEAFYCWRGVRPETKLVIDLLRK